MMVNKGIHPQMALIQISEVFEFSHIDVYVYTHLCIHMYMYIHIYTVRYMIYVLNICT